MQKSQTFSALVLEQYKQFLDSVSWGHFKESKILRDF